PKGRNYEYKLEVSFEEAARLEPQRLTLRTGKTLQVKLPAGFEEGQQIRLAGQGDPGPGGAGDAIVTLHVTPHAWFKREGDNVLLDLPLRLDEAVLGAKLKAPTVDGAVMLSVPPGSTSGKLLRLRGKGFTRKDGTRGDQLVRLMVDIGEPDDELRRFAEKWAAGKGHNPRSSWGLS
ncbi:MAG TPA: J domain-containing protein, partial [Pedomonas sp.]|uniref:J domain-containing protein n=1 Tax=Pedomonas sp. TaxID=2976421 RepID=UPI002F3FD701